MIFFGHGRKAKTRGALIYPCFHCDVDLALFDLVASYRYGQLYGVRVAKHHTTRLMLCRSCSYGHELTKEQWSVAMRLSDQVQALPSPPQREHAIPLVIRTAYALFDQGDEIDSLYEADDDPPPDGRHELEDGPETDLDGDAARPIEAGAEYKTCPDCAESVRAAARKCRYCGYRFEAASG